MRPGGRIGLHRDELEKFAKDLNLTDEVVLEATTNTAATDVWIPDERTHAGRRPSRGGSTDGSRRSSPLTDPTVRN